MYGDLSGDAAAFGGSHAAKPPMTSLLPADAPTGNLDPANAAGIMDLFQSLNADGLPMLVVTHHAAWAKRSGVRAWSMPLGG